LTNPGAEARQRYYKVKGTPTWLCNGKEAAGGGGGADAAPKKFLDYQKAIEPLLDIPATVKLQVRTTSSGDRITAEVQVRDLAKPGAKVKLRAMLVEDFVRYRGGNGTRIHRSVVRAALSPEEGIPLEQAQSKHELRIDAAVVRRDLGNYLDQWQKDNPDVQFIERPLKLSRLRIVAFVQDDQTQEVLQAVQADVK
jgi:hypothetical protein